MKGPIAIFDILGYQSFLEKNADLKDAAKVIDLIAGIPVALAKGWLTTDQPKNKATLDRLRSCFHSLVFSDTIVCGFELGDLGEKQHDEAWAFLTFYARSLYQTLFLHGLPIRGCIHYGDFLLRSGCIAGSAVVSAYKTLSDVDMAAVLVTSEASTEMKRLSASVGALGSVLSELTPSFRCAMKSGKEVEYHVVDVLPEPLRDPKMDREYAIRESFWMLNKDIPESAEVKVTKTKKLFDYFLFHSMQLEANGGRLFGGKPITKRKKRLTRKGVLLRSAAKPATAPMVEQARMRGEG